MIIVAAIVFGAAFVMLMAIGIYMAIRYDDD